MSANTLTPTWVKIAAVIGIIWYAFGLMQFYLGATMNTVQAITDGTISPAHGAAIDGTPMLVWAAFALASLAGLTGAALLLGGRPTAKLAFAVSLVSALVYYVWVYALSGTGGDRPSEEIGIAAMVIFVTVGFNVLSRKAT